MSGSRRLLGRAAAALVATAVVAAGCGDDAGEESGPDASTTTTTVSVSSDEEVAGPTTSVPGLPPTTRGVPDPVTVEPIPDPIPAVVVLSGEPAYRGVLGQLRPDQIVVQPVALPPAPAADGVAPLTGLPTDDETLATRTAILAKYDNTEDGRPQESLGLADIVYVEQIEGGFTRLAAVFHTHTPTLGPIRSGRTSDIALLGSLGEPVFVWSGASRVHGALIRRQDFVDLGAQTRREYTRDPDRPGTYDLMTEASELLAIAAGDGRGGTPQPHFEYRNDVTGLPESAEPATAVTITYPSVGSQWAWSATDGGWLRSQDGTPHVDAAGEQIVATNVVVAFVDQVATGAVDLAGSRVNEELFIGQGEALVFTAGHVVEATWTKPSIDSVPTYTTADGVPIAMGAGTTWVELAPVGSAAYS